MGLFDKLFGNRQQNIDYQIGDAILSNDARNEKANRLLEYGRFLYTLNSSAIEYKQWFKFIEDTLKDIPLLYDVWYSIYQEEAVDFTEKFISAYNAMAEK